MLMTQESAVWLGQCLKPYTLDLIQNAPTWLDESPCLSIINHVATNAVLCGWVLEDLGGGGEKGSEGFG